MLLYIMFIECYNIWIIYGYFVIHSGIQAQAAANAGEPAQSMPETMKMIVAKDGVAGLFKGIVPRIGLGVWQTLFMVTGAKMVKEAMAKN